jgi:FHA domain
MAISTLTDLTAKEPAESDELVQLRRWARNKNPIKLPRLPTPSRRVDYVIGTEQRCDFHVSDPLVSKQHARFVHDQDGWKIYDLHSKNGLYIDRQRCEWAPLRAGTEIGLGTKFVLIAESARTMALRGFLQRLLGWEEEDASTVDLALRSVLAVKPGRSYALVSKSDPVAIAYSIHRLALGTGRPFITCDPKREITNETVRSTENYKDGVEALAHAARGTLCVISSRLPRDFDKISSALIEPTATARLVVCSTEPIDGKRFLTAPIVVPSLSDRAPNLDRIIYDYAVDAIAEFGGNSLQPPRREDLQLVAKLDAGTLAKIETATLRLAAFRVLPNINQVAARLGMTRNALVGWFKRRGLDIDISEEIPTDGERENRDDR